MICLQSLTGLEGWFLWDAACENLQSVAVPTVREILATREHAERDHIVGSGSVRDFEAATAVNYFSLDHTEQSTHQMGAISHDSALQAQELADSLACQANSEVFRASEQIFVSYVGVLVTGSGLSLEFVVTARAP